MTRDQIKALELLLSVLHPPVVAQLATQGTRESWSQIIAAANTLQPLLEPAPAEPPPPTAPSTSPSSSS